MTSLSKVFDNLVAVSQGDTDALSRATNEFTRAITAGTVWMPLDSFKTATTTTTNSSRSSTPEAPQGE